ncbi:MAG: SUMF1/EgtB/PvdO family nonheme iron enzyme [Planctomycetota bacterium]
MVNVVFGADVIEESITNTIGMKLVRIKSGRFLMGSKEGKIADGVDIDESPAHKVMIGKDFYMGVTEVTNAQYEKFRAGHRKTSGKADELSNGDNEAVIHVSWHDAVAFCKWLSDKEKKPYRLPTEAEWEYACRAGTTGLYNTGNVLPENYHKNQKIVVGPKKVSLVVGQTPVNGWGLYDMHGNVEEWCLDWYGPYVKVKQVDPIGYEEGDFRVTRGGSHSTLVRYLQSANRMAAIPEDKHWLLGFRVVMGERPKGKGMAVGVPSAGLSGVSQKKYKWQPKVDMTKPFFSGPIEYVRKPAVVESVPFYSHNHCSGFTYCDNGDLLAVWFSVAIERDREKGREMTVLVSRLREGKKQWDMPSEFYKVPDRNMTGSALINDRKGRLFYFNGVSVADHWRVNNALIMRYSDDNGQTWSRTRIINPVRGISSQPIGSAYCDQNGWLIVPSDWPAGKPGGGSALWISRDSGKSWSVSKNPIEGIHAGVVTLNDGTIMGLGRHRSKKGSMPMSISKDNGDTWEYSNTQFPGIGGGQRFVLRKLREGPLLLISFSDVRPKERKGNSQKPVEVIDKAGKKRKVYGLYAALSYDDGKTWKIAKPITPSPEPRRFNGGAWTGEFSTDATHAEHAGYCSGIQTPDGMFHLISSALHYRFNLAWLKEPMPGEK